MVLLATDESVFTAINGLWALLVILIAVGMAFVVLLSKKKDETAITNEKSSQANAALVLVRDKQITDLLKDKCELEEELEEITAEHKTIIGIKMDDLIRWYMFYMDKEAHWRNVEDENILLRKQIAEGKK